jgi:hypothetical protein
MAYEEVATAQGGKDYCLTMGLRSGGFSAGFRPVPRLWGLDISDRPSQNTANFDTKPKQLPSIATHFATAMTPKQPSQPTKQKISRELCKHPQVQIVSRDEDSEYVECKECGDIFESSEFKDMRIEETKLRDDEE